MIAASRCSMVRLASPVRSAMASTVCEAWQCACRGSGCDEPVRKHGQRFCCQQHRQLADIQRRRRQMPEAVYSEEGVGVDTRSTLRSAAIPREITGIDRHLVARLNESWRVVLDDSPRATPSVAVAAIQIVKRELVWDSQAFCQTRHGLLTAIREKIVKADRFYKGGHAMAVIRPQWRSSRRCRKTSMPPPPKPPSSTASNATTSSSGRSAATRTAKAACSAKSAPNP